MAVSQYHTATEFVANQLTFTRGNAGAIEAVGVYHDTDPGVIPEVSDFEPADLIVPPNALAEGSKIDVLSLIGPDNGGIVLAPGVYQRWILVSTANENIIRRPDTITIV